MEIGKGMGMKSWEWDGMGTVNAIPAHLYKLYLFCQLCSHGAYELLQTVGRLRSHAIRI